MAVVAKTSRINIRISEQDKNVLEQAALFNKQTLSNYILNVAIKQAQIDLVENETLYLNNAARDKVLELLANPPIGNDKLKALLKDD